MSDNVVNLDSTNFEKQVYQSEIPFFVQFSTPWCAPCRTFSPIMDSLADQFKGQCMFGKINAEDNMELAYNFNISAVPTMIIFQKDQVIDRINGLIGRDKIVEKIENAIKMSLPENP